MPELLSYDDPDNQGELIQYFAKLTCADSQGCPVGLQISCLPYEDEKVVGIAKQLENILPFKYLPLKNTDQYKTNM
jgi:hypothetical protein